MRKIKNMNQNWVFKNANRPPEKVDVPHTWNALDGQDGGDDYFRGTMVYEKAFDYPEINKQQKAVYLEFLGVNASCEVYLNDGLVTQHHGGYSTFRVNITDSLKAQNHLRVKVENTVNDKVYPQKADFTFYGGIYRDVNLIEVDASHFTLDQLGTPGIKITSDVIGKDAVITVETEAQVDKAIIEIDIKDQEGNSVAQSKGGLIQKIDLKSVNLWHGIENPYLYTAVASLVVEGEIKDQVSSKFGVRTFHVDPQKGFFLNGKSFPLRGVSRHQDFKGLGNAISKVHHDNDMALIKEIGANTVRLAHYQHDQYFYDLCDEVGMIVWAEIPYISEHMPNGRENTISQMKELIIQNYNHPSIVTWGVSNEITISTKDKKDMLDNHHELNDLCHEMDPNRPTTLACYAMCNPFSKVAHLTDLVGYNLYLGWYVPGLFLNDIFMKGFHFLYPNMPLGYSEYGCEGMPNLHSEKPRRGDHTEEYQAIYHEYMLECFERHPFLWATHVWNMFDFAADARNQGGEPGMNHKGLVTFDRKTKKDSFYLYQAYWTKQPMVHICSKRFVERNQKTIKIKVYSNQPRVTLYQDGKIVGEKTAKHVFEFKVNLDKETEIVAVAGAQKDKAVFKYVSVPNKSYKLDKSKSSSSNWVG